MARSQLDFRKNVNDSDSSSSSGVVGAFGGAPPGSTILAPMEITSRDSSSFGTRAEGEPVAVLVHRGRPTPSVRPNALPGQDVGVPEQDWGNHVSYLWSSPRSSKGDRWGFGEVSMSGTPTSHTYNNSAIGSAGEDFERAGQQQQWSNNSMLSHRRCNSAPNISSSWRGAGLPSLPSGILAPDLRDHTIPEGRRFEAVEPPLQPSITAPDRPRSWRVRTTAPPWGAGPASGIDFGTREPSSSGPMDWVPKLRASYFVNVRSQGEAPTPGSSVGGLIPQSMAAADSRPFEEIKRMRLSQALDSSSGAPQQQQDGLGMLGLTPSPTFSTSGRAPHFDTSRLTPRFSPGKGVKVSGFTSALNCRPGPAAFGGAGGVTFGPLSPALTEPPTPPSHWKVQEPEAFASKAVANRANADPQGVLPMEQRPMDEVSAVQALMSVGLGTSGGLGTSAQPAEATPAAAISVAAPQQAGALAGSSSVGAGATAAFGPAAGDSSEASRSPVPSLERLKPFEGGGDDDDDGLDKDLWVVVEKGSVCASRDCVYRDAAARVASRRHYHSKCTHTHNGGEKKGMVFHHHQLEKVQKHQRSHKREATKSAPYKRTTPEDHQAMEGAGVEGYRPADWSPEETRQLDELVKQLVAPVTHAWPSIARFFPTKTSIQCLLHWRFTLNDNGIIRGNGTWGAEEDERLRKLAPVFSSPSTGPRWAKIAEVMPGRTAKQCRERYNNHVDPAIKKDKIWSAEEDALVMQLHAEHHNQFAKIARSIPGRCYDDVKNRFNLLVKRRQLAGRAASSSVPGPGNKASRPPVEGPGPETIEGRTRPPPFEGTATAGLFRNPSVVQQPLP